MTRPELILAVSRQTGETLGIVEQISDTIFARIRDTLDRDRRVDIEGFGEFRMQRQPSRTDLRSGLFVPAYNQIVFKAAKAWCRPVNGA